MQGKKMLASGTSMRAADPERGTGQISINDNSVKLFFGKSTQIGLMIALIMVIGAGTFLAALNVKYRDFRYTIPFLLQVLFFSSQVIYPLYSVQQTWLKYLLAINPVNAAIELFRATLSNHPIDSTTISIGLTSTVIIFFVGLYYFRKTEAYFADLA